MFLVNTYVGDEDSISSAADGIPRKERRNSEDHNVAIGKRAAAVAAGALADNPGPEPSAAGRPLPNRDSAYRQMRTGPFPVVEASQAGFVASCALRCGTDILLPATSSTHRDSKLCSCDAKTCSATIPTAYPCCPDMTQKCGTAALEAAFATTGAATLSAPLPIPGFPPMHNGPEANAVDVLAVVPSRGVSTAALSEWLEWLRYAGVGLFHIYDCGDAAGAIRSFLAPYIAEGYVVYSSWAGRCGRAVDPGADGAALKASWATLQLKAWDDVTRVHGRTTGVALWRAQLEVGSLPLWAAAAAPTPDAGFLATYLLQQSATVGLVQASSQFAEANAGARSSSAAATAAARYFIRVSHASGFGIHKGGSWLETVSSAGVDTGDTGGGGICISSLVSAEDAGRTPLAARVPLDAYTKLNKLAESETLFAGLPSIHLRAKAASQLAMPLHDLSQAAAAAAGHADASMGGAQSQQHAQDTNLASASDHHVASARVWPPPQ